MRKQKVSPAIKMRPAPVTGLMQFPVVRAVTERNMLCPNLLEIATQNWLLVIDGAHIYLDQ